MTDSPRLPGGDLPVGMYLTSSFTEHLRHHAPELLPQNRIPMGQQDFRDAAPHGTTIVAVAYPGGVVLAGDRRATVGNLIASRDMRKVYITDEHSAAGIAGTAGIAIEMVRLFAVELEHYEKIEGFPLTLDGKANRLSAMVRGNMGLALQGLAAIPILVGVDPPPDGVDADDSRPGRIFSFDVAGDRHEEHAGYQAIGSGSVFAKSSLKKLYRTDLTAESALAIAVESLYDAADDDSATGGPDVTRGLYPTAVQVSADGAEDVDESRISNVANDIIARRTSAAASSDGNTGERGAER